MSPRKVDDSNENNSCIYVEMIAVVVDLEAESYLDQNNMLRQILKHRNSGEEIYSSSLKLQLKNKNDFLSP